MKKTMLNDIIKRLDNIEKKLDLHKKMLTVDDVSSYTGISKSYLYKLTSSQSIPHYKPTGKRDVCPILYRQRRPGTGPERDFRSSGGPGDPLSRGGREGPPQRI